MSLGTPKRRALIGFSGPVAYDYFNPAETAPGDEYSSPNPVLDSPFGMMLLFDEIWFVTKSLCPQNMRACSFVKFLDEEFRPPDPKGKQWGDIERILKEDPAWAQAEEKFSSGGVRWLDSISQVGVYWEAGVDNHTHGIKIGDFEASGNADLHKLITDFLIAEEFSEIGLEVITNSITQQYLDPASGVYPNAALTERLIIRNIPNYLTPDGPYHPAIDEIREDSYLKSFRKWMAECHENVSLAEIEEIRSSVENELEEAQRRVFLKHLDSRGHYFSVGKAFAGDVIGLVLPGVSTGAAVYEEIKEKREKAKSYWQGFLVRSQMRVR